MKWLSSIPYFAKPFDLKLQKIPNLIKHLIDDLIDPQFRVNTLIVKYISLTIFSSIEVIISEQKVFSIFFIHHKCYQQCFIDHEPNCVKQRQHKISCDTEFASTNPTCVASCKRDGFRYINYRL